MSFKPVRCRLITPTARVLDAEVNYAEVPLHDGQIGIVGSTAPIVGKLGPGVLRLETSSGERRFAIDGGFMQQVGGVLTILATGAIEDKDLDPAEEKAALAEAKSRTSTDYEEMQKITEDRKRATVRTSLAQAAR